MRLNQVTLPARDVAMSAAFYRRMGFEQIVDAPAYARFLCEDGGATFSIHQRDAAAAAGVVVYFECDDLDARVDALAARGIAFDTPPTDQSWRWREARLRDPDGNALCLYRAGADRTDPPWRVSIRD